MEGGKREEGDWCLIYYSFRSKGVIYGRAVVFYNSGGTLGGGDGGVTGTSYPSCPQPPCICLAGHRHHRPRRHPLPSLRGGCRRVDVGTLYYTAAVSWG